MPEAESFVEKGLTHGRRKEFTGGGLIRSFGGWTKARNILKDREHVMRRGHEKGSS